MASLTPGLMSSRGQGGMRAFRSALLLTPLAAAAPTGAGSGQWAEIPDEDPSGLRNPPPTYQFVSSTLGDHMVLQRAPQQAVVWGHADPNTTVTTTFNGAALTSTADGNGTWRQKLPAMPASRRGTSYTLAFKSSDGQSAQLRDVVFGDVYICGGQSNMQYSVAGVTNASAEMQAGDAYPHIRLFTVGCLNHSNWDPWRDLGHVEQKWAPASAGALGGAPGDYADPTWNYFSAVCWFFGRRVSDALGPDVPLGLISNNVGGTSIEKWSPNWAAACPAVSGPYPGKASSALWNAMIVPYTIGPMAVTGFTWYQGEADITYSPKYGTTGADGYACVFPFMIAAWREAFANPTAYFGFVQLSTWCAAGIPELREAQMAAVRLPKVGYATNADHGAGCTIHMKTKQPAGERLGDSALALQYGRGTAWRSPTYASARASVAAGAGGRAAVATVTVSLSDVSGDGLTTDVYPFNQVPNDGSKLECANPAVPSQCAWGAVKVGGAWHNATVAAAAGGKQLVLEAALNGTRADAEAAGVTASAYGWGAIPMMNAYDVGTRLPVLPWNRSVA